MLPPARCDNAGRPPDLPSTVIVTLVTDGGEGSKDCSNLGCLALHGRAERPQYSM